MGVLGCALLTCTQYTLLAHSTLRAHDLLSQPCKSAQRFQECTRVHALPGCACVHAGTPTGVCKTELVMYQLYTRPALTNTRYRVFALLRYCGLTSTRTGMLPHSSTHAVLLKLPLTQLHNLHAIHG